MGQSSIIVNGVLSSDQNIEVPLSVNASGQLFFNLENSESLSWPSTWQLDFTSLAGAADNNVLYTSADVSEYNYHIIENESGVSCDVYVSVNGTTYSTAAASVELADDVTTGGGVKVITIPDNKVGILRGKFKKVRILQDGAGTPAAGTIRGFHGVE